MADLLNFMPSRPVLLTFMQYSLMVCSIPEEASDVITGAIVSQIVSNNIVKFGEPGPNHC